MRITSIRGQRNLTVIIYVYFAKKIICSAFCLVSIPSLENMSDSCLKNLYRKNRKGALDCNDDDAHWFWFSKRLRCSQHEHKTMVGNINEGKYRSNTKAWKPNPFVQNLHS